MSAVVPATAAASAVRAAERLGVMQLVLSLQPGGTERLVVEIVKRAGPGVRFLVCCLDEPGAWAAEVEARGVPIVALGRRPGFRPGLAVRIARLCARRRIGVIHCHHYSPFVYGRLAALLRPGTRVLFTEHGRLSDAPPSRKRRLVNPILGRTGASIFAVSRDLRDHMIGEGFPADRVGVILNGIDPGLPPSPGDRAAARRGLGLATEDLAIGTVARLDPVKDIPVLVEALAEVQRVRRRATLIVVGDGPERATIEAAARRAGVTDAVRLTGHRADARALLPALDIYANSSITEGVSLTLLEAMAACLPIVATHVGGTPEVVADGETGVLVPARRPDEVARAVLALAADPERGRAMGRAGRRRLEERFTLDRMVSEYVRAYLGPGASH